MFPCYTPSIEHIGHDILKYSLLLPITVSFEPSKGSFRYDHSLVKSQLQSVRTA